jgi:diguanylate cyclase (GGDEF)-like protein/PAS domain S-box-containing protein
MRKELTQSAQQLLESESRYRQLLTSIKETVIQIDIAGHWQFLSPVWEKLSGHDISDSLNHPVTDFLHPVDHAKINQVLSLLNDGKQQDWNGEVRLKKADSRYIWVNISLQLSNDELQSKQTINGTIENIHIIRVSRDVNQLIRTTEQMVLTSHCSVATLLEFTTQELVYILGVLLAWVKVCKDNHTQILNYAGDGAGFLFDNGNTWSGIHKEGSPVMSSVQQHSVIRVTADSELPPEWKQRLQHDDIKDSLFLPFFIGGDTKAVIGLHTNEANIFDEDFKQVMTSFSAGLRLICQMAEDQNLMRLHRAAVEKTANAIMITDSQGTIEWVNDAFVRQTLFQPDDVLGKTSRVLKLEHHDDDVSIKDMWQTIKAGEVWSGELINRRKDGQLITMFQTITPLFDHLGEIIHFVAVMEDVTERKADQERIAFMATHDELTELPNRNLLNDRLHQAIAHADRQNTKMAVLFIDIDQFKFINDSLGHQLGDDLLQLLAKRLVSVLRTEDTVARFGGDEFVVLLPEVAEISDVKILANNLLNQIQKPYVISGHELMVTGSIGISVYPDDASDADDLIQLADSAMYLAKEQGRNNSQFYTPEINEKIMRRLTLEKELRKALEQEQFVLFYQPKIDLSSNKITGMEALVRWQHPTLGLVPPMEFIPLAEETGIIIPLGEWIMLTACKQMTLWEKEYPDLINMSINVSARQFWKNDFVESVRNVFNQTSVSADKIEFELTESVVMNDIESAIKTMVAIKLLGVSLSIDDFGTGYSSLNYLKRFPLDVLKIDRSFINDLENEHSDSAIVRSIIALADNFGLRVVAEGIEEAYQQQILTDLGCHFGQGYHFSRPVDFKEMTKQLKEQ